LARPSFLFERQFEYWQLDTNCEYCYGHGPSSPMEGGGEGGRGGVDTNIDFSSDSTHSETSFDKRGLGHANTHGARSSKRGGFMALPTSIVISHLHNLQVRRGGIAVPTLWVAFTWKHSQYWLWSCQHSKYVSIYALAGVAMPTPNKRVSICHYSQ